MLASKIVPDDTRAHVYTLLKEILQTPGRAVATKVLYTDDVVKDANTIVSLFQELGLEVK